MKSILKYEEPQINLEVGNVWLLPYFCSVYYSWNL